MTITIGTCYDKNKNEMPTDYTVINLPELELFLNEIASKLENSV